MKILDRHLFRRVLYTFVFSLCTLSIVYTIIDLLTHRRDDIIDYDVPIYIVAEYYTMLIPETLLNFHLGGLAMLLAILSVLGASAQRNEFVAVLSSGVSLRRFVFAPLGVALAVCGALLVLSDTVAPVAAKRVLDIKSQYFGQTDGTGQRTRRPISWADLSDGWKCHVSKFNRIALTGEEVLMMASREGIEEQIRAKRIFWDDAARKWMIEDGVWSVFYPDQGMAVTTRRITLEPAPILETPEDLFAPFENLSTRSLSALRRIIDESNRRGIPSGRLRLEYHARFARAALPLIMTLFAIPLAARIRRGGRAAGISLAIGLSLAYLVVFGVGNTLGATGRVVPMVGAWLANAIFFVGALAMFSRTPT